MANKKKINTYGEKIKPSKHPRPDFFEAGLED
jgi:hypothetical protein